ncbi:long-chain fatty acid transport protein 2-like [Tubulanus polymorphus]|uniref:long-chain fatty acid transport protein 2-like n=1 Tax=Tubulanus polymorphus TaxID=672921 RepID=UPI003DA4AFB4
MTMSWSVVIAAAVGSVPILLTYLKPWIWSDLYYSYKMITLLGRCQYLVGKKCFLIDLFERTVKKCPKKTMLHFGDRSYTFEEVDRRATKFANALLKKGFKQGDTVTLLMYNDPAFIWILLGFAKLGIAAALLNTNLRMKTLLHCFKSAEACALFVAHEDLIEAVDEIRDDVLKEADVYILDDSDAKEGFINLKSTIDEAEETPINKSIHRNKQTFRTPFAYIYTSGTTGLPKPAIISQFRSIAGIFVSHGTDLKESDVLYSPLPLYHSAAIMLALGACIDSGCTLVLRRKFSASQFLDDCRKYDVTVIQYIGELCRYLAARPELPNDGEHGIRLAFGNGLRPDVWKTFNDRFGIEQIREFYAATEGVGFYMNLNNVFGSVGRQSSIMNMLHPSPLVKYDYNTEEPARDQNGLCILAKPGEAGIYTCMLKQKKGIEFDGYKGKKEMNEKKILRNVLKNGDAFYNSGDLLYMDQNYNVFFKDRLGDTFRWKGENVSTTEVGNLIAELEFVNECNVYGVEVPGCDGRAGMVTMVTKNNALTLCDAELVKLFKHCVEYLPSYARPMFLRVNKEIQVTSTFKHIKLQLRDEGFNPHEINGALYFLDGNNSTYSILTTEIYDHIVSGKIKL